LTYQWNWGDGLSSTGISKFHTYERGGFYNISLTVKDLFGGSSTTTTTVIIVECGDGILEPGEKCDDGNRIDNDNCSNSCTLPKCGDGITQPSLGEQCDDANTINTDNCTNVCLKAACGDTYVQPGEICDLGSQNGANDSFCGANCQYAGGGTSLCKEDWQCLCDKQYCTKFGTCAYYYGFATNCTCKSPAFVVYEGPVGSQKPMCLHPPECTQSYQCPPWPGVTYNPGTCIVPSGGLVGYCNSLLTTGAFSIPPVTTGRILPSGTTGFALPSQTPFTRPTVATTGNIRTSAARHSDQFVVPTGDNIVELSSSTLLSFVWTLLLCATYLFN